ncbi:hypothetical protein CDAR_10541 [Caerostris darwini]|uniref:Ribosomal protein S10 n=1 Tax=Caerostris darwini TaxID=1538125 RepID=A0AAV4NSA3_9ARAC|nr:hypothetical protein CDAR_10541 [Caerostris darwini]
MAPTNRTNKQIPQIKRESKTCRFGTKRCFNSPGRFINVLFGAPEKENLIKRAPSAELAALYGLLIPQRRGAIKLHLMYSNTFIRPRVQISSPEQREIRFTAAFREGSKPEEELKRGVLQNGVVNCVLRFH